MKFEYPQTLEQIAGLLSCTYYGDSNLKITGINEIHRVQKGDIVFVDHPKYYDKALNSDASVIIIDKKVEFPKGKGILVSQHPFDDFNKITVLFQSSFEPNILNEDLQLKFPGASIGKNVKIGKNVTIFPGACILDRTVIDDNVIIGPNSVIGHSAFYYKKQNNQYTPMNSCGYVHIEEGVEIGAMCTIDRGVTDVTRIGQGSKIDNHVHIGHDTQIGKNCLMAAHVGIAGCVIVEPDVIIWGQVGIASGVTIGASAIILAQSGVSKNLIGNKTYFGSPCGEVKEKFKEMAALRQLPDMLSKST